MSGAKEDQVRWILSGKGDRFGVSDLIKTSAQHYATVEGDDTITVFDNGNGCARDELYLGVFRVESNRRVAVKAKPDSCSEQKRKGALRPI